MPNTVVIGLSGGVDSSVAAWLLKQQGYRVIGLFMKNWEDDDNSEYCSSQQDWLDAVSVADVLDIDIEAVNFAAEYKDRVFSIFLSEYQAGRTPNPDILCNSEIKFKAFLNHAYSLGADFIATGHYARVKHLNNEVQLLKGLDPTKDQSYFLHRLNQEQLARTLFPVGELVKTQVRNIAQQLNLHNAKKKDSTGICFIGERPFREFLNRYLPTQPGPILNDQNQRIGEHIGLSFYTLGQRKGIGIGGLKGNSLQEPWFVAKKDVQNNILYAVQGHNHPWLHTTHLKLEQTHFISGHAPTNPQTISAKTRYRQPDAQCTLLPQGQPEQYQLHFKDPQFAPTPGQSAVFYQGDVCLGGGVIQTVLNTL